MGKGRIHPPKWGVALRPKSSADELKHVEKKKNSSASGAEAEKVVRPRKSSKCAKVVLINYDDN